MTRMEPIAIIGMAGRFPGAPDLHDFWRNLKNGVESIARFSEDELRRSGVDPSVLRDPSYVPARGMVSDAEFFDAAFFGINPREAEVLDPQHRFFLESAWEAFEDAGYDPDRQPRPTGVFAGTTMSTYLLSNLLANPELLRTVGAYQTMLGNDKDYLATRVSYKLNLHGPSMVIQTACSTSLVAVHLACDALLTGQCDMALAGGVSISFPQRAGYLYQPGMILSPDGHCRAFDAHAAGTVGGEGVGVVVLKRLADALTDGDHVRAVIRGSAINNDGSLKVGYTAPSVDGQAEVIARAQSLGGVNADTISYIEAHGTGTELGDPIEIAALTKAFRATTDRTGFCAIGSVKTNIGHLDAAAGVAGLIKAVLALEHETIPPSLHFERPNPQIDFEQSPFCVNSAVREWPRNAAPRRAGVSSFGIGGTNAHVVLEEAPARNGKHAGPDGGPELQLLPLSARTVVALDSARERLAHCLRGDPALPLADVAFTLQRGRKEFPYRLALVARDAGDAAAALANGRGTRIITSPQAAGEHSVAFLFPGQGAQYATMGRGLYDREPLFRAEVDTCAELITTPLGIDLRTLLYPPEANMATADERLRQTRIAQPALFVTEYALAKLWLSAGMRPDAMLGHSIGEYVAACLAGVFSLEDALALVVERGRLMDIPGGAMLAVPLAPARLEPLLDGDLTIAAANAPQLCVASGPEAEVARLEQRLARAGTPGRRLYTAHAFHSAMMEPALEPFARAVARVRLSPPRIPFLSNVSGTWIADAEATDPSYWVRHIRSTVRFSDGLRRLLDEPTRVLLEVGPGNTLSTLARQHQATQRIVVSSLRHPRETTDDRETFLGALGRLWVAGVPVAWDAAGGPEAGRRVSLPTYPFERQRFWVEPQPARQVSDVQLAIRKDSEITNWFYLPSWQRVPLSPIDPAAARAAWLVLCDPRGLGQQIVERLHARGDTAIAVLPGEHFDAGQDGARYAVAPGSVDDLVAMLGDLEQRGVTPTRVVHCWSLAPATPPDLPEEETHRRLQRDGFQTLAAFVQAMGARRMHEEIQLGIVTDQLQRVAREAVLAPLRATMLGACMVIPQEHPEVTCRSLDVATTDVDETTPELVDALIAEFEQPRDEAFVALRDGQRWLRSFVPYPLETGPRPELLRDHGVYLLTGGLGGVGLTLAGYLARAVGARLVLVARSALPPQNMWDDVLSSPDAPADVARRIRAVRELETAGAEVLILQADVTDRAQMERCLAAARERFGSIDGVIHAAGALDLEMIRERSVEASARALAPKVEGASLLLSLLANAPTDFVVLCSSVSATLGGLGRAEYAGSNACLDALARADARHGARPRVIAIAWDTWRDVGMSTQGVVPPQGSAGDEYIANSIRPAEGVETFARALRAGMPEIIVSDRVLPYSELVRRALPPRAPRRRDVDATASQATPSGPSHDRPDVSTIYVEPASEIERAVAALWQQLLGIERVGLNDDFFELGGHSLLATQLISRLRETFGIRLPLRALFEATTVAALAERVELLRWGMRSARDGAPDVDREEIEI
jgi:acyl transferase domain-containing protein/acyl carrier protein